MINKKFDKIMCDYVQKGSDFCREYTEHALEKGYSTFSSAVYNCLSAFEDYLWKLRHDTEALLNNAISAEASNAELAELDRIKKDLNTMHKYYTHRYAALITKGLSEQWNEEASGFAVDLLKSTVINIRKEGGKLW